MNAEWRAALDLLRRAAALMRERAEKATPGTWQANPDGLVWANPPRLGDPVSGSTEIEDAQHIASWHPAVALAAADWLEAEARIHDAPDAVRSGMEKATGQEWEVRATVSTLPLAAAFARAYLGEVP